MITVGNSSHITKVYE